MKKFNLNYMNKIIPKDTRNLVTTLNMKHFNRKFLPATYNMKLETKA